jgi:methylenetetrahydrofolate reductase (NADPH)
MDGDLITHNAYRYELLPFASAQEQACLVDKPLTLTVTCSPKHGPDRSVEVAGTLRALGHRVVVHIAARMVRHSGHMGSLLTRMASLGVNEVFLIGGDAPKPAGSYPSSLPLLREMREHPLAPATIGVAAYPEGHPAIPEPVLLADLRAKDGLADYMTTQMCFDPDVVVRWLEHVRDAGIGLPAQIGTPGEVDRRRLLEISLLVGVGNSVSFLRKQHGVRSLFGHAHATAESLRNAFAPLIGGALDVSGLHFFTFNRLVETVRFAELRAGEHPSGPPAADLGSVAIAQEPHSR